VYVTALEDVKKIIPDMEGAKGVHKQIPISKENGTPTFSFRVFTIDPGGHTPHHTHSFEHLNYIIEGRGTVLVQDGEHKMKKGNSAMIPPGETHQYRNTSISKPLVIICAVPKEYE
jgi:quercetin dioxygenase-like cupin family protein